MKHDEAINAAEYMMYDVDHFVYKVIYNGESVLLGTDDWDEALWQAEEVLEMLMD